MTTGNPATPVNAIRPAARAHCQMRFVVGSDAASLLAQIRARLDAGGFDDVEVRASGTPMAATRLDPENEWVRWGPRLGKRQACCTDHRWCSPLEPSPPSCRPREGRPRPRSRSPPQEPPPP
jgi:hypothetical protein